ncbi:MAG: RSP_7527 family protein [Betaproteobacteria bacterium]
MTTKYTYRTPTAAELYAVEQEARRLRAEAIASALKAGVLKVKALFERPVSRNVRHA